MKRWLRRFVLASAVGPVAALYRGIYGGVARWAVLALRRCRGVCAVYLTRGGARGELVPGVSDLDFIVVVEDEGALAAVQSAGRSLARATAGLVEYYPNFVASRAQFAHRWQSAPAWQYRIDEGRRSWKLRFGEDLLAALPPLPPERLATATYLEFCRWWLVFARLLAEGDAERDVVVRNATCYKAVSELLRVDPRRRAGERRRSRAEALAADGSPLAVRLQTIAARRYLPDDPSLVEATCRFLFDFFTELWREFPRRPFVAVRPGVVQSLAAAPDAAAPGDEALRHHARELGETAWEPDRPATHVLASAFWPAEERLLVFDGDPRRPPSAAQIVALVREHRRRWRALRSLRPHLVLRLGEVGFPLVPSLPRDLHRGLLTPATTPDVFLQLGSRAVYWSDLTAWYLADWRSNEQWLDASAATRARLERIAAGAAAGAIVYPSLARGSS